MNMPCRILSALLLSGALVPAASAGIVSNLDTITVNVFDVDLPDADTNTPECDVDAVTPGDQCTLRAAVQTANTNAGFQTILVGLDQTIELDLAGGGSAAGDLDITDTVRITGIGAAGTMPENADRLTIVEAAPGFDDRLFQIAAGAGNVIIEGLQLRHGSAVSGGLIGGAISNSAALTVRHSRFEHNAALRGGAIDSVAGASLLVEDSDFAFNTADEGSAIFADHADTTIRRSSFRDHRDEGGLYPRFAIQSTDAALVVENSTVSGASAGAPGYTPNGGILVDNPTLFHLRNSTLVDFPATYPADVAVRFENVVADTPLRIAHSILAREEGDLPVCQAPETGLTDFVIDDSILSSAESECEAYLAADAELEVQPELGSFLQTQARVTWHREPSIGSNLIDAGRPDAAATDPTLLCTTEDQNRIPRPLDGDVDGEARCDLGAVEVQSGLFIVNDSTDTDDATPGDGVCETVFGNGMCTLRAAVMEANAHIGADLIRFLPDIGHFISLDQAAAAGADGGDLDITEAVTIEGNQNAQGLPPTTLVQERAGERLFEIDVPTGHRVRFRGLHFHEGNAVGFSGGAIRIAAGDAVVVEQSVFSENSSDVAGGAISVIDGSLDVRGSDFHHNHSDDGAAIFLDGDASARIESSSFWRNTAAGVERSTLFVSPGATFFLENSTIAFNDGGVVALEPDFMRLDHTTLAWNTERGLSVDFGAGLDRLLLRTSIIADNGVGDCSITDPEQAHTLSIDAFNLDTDGSCSGGLPSNVMGDPDLDVAPESELPLQRPSGQLTRVAPPRDSPNNPALDALASGALCHATDQIGTPRPQQLPSQPDDNGSCDLGAFERLSPVIFGDGLEQPETTGVAGTD